MVSPPVHAALLSSLASNWTSAAGDAYVLADGKKQWVCCEWWEQAIAHGYIYEQYNMGIKEGRPPSQGMCLVGCTPRHDSTVPFAGWCAGRDVAFQHFICPRFCSAFTFPPAVVTPLVTCSFLGRSCPEFAFGSYWRWLNIGFKGDSSSEFSEGFAGCPAEFWNALSLRYPGVSFFSKECSFSLHLLACLVCVWTHEWKSRPCDSWCCFHHVDPRDWTQISQACQQVLSPAEPSCQPPLVFLKMFSNVEFLPQERQRNWLMFCSQSQCPHDLFMLDDDSHTSRGSGLPCFK